MAHNIAESTHDGKQINTTLDDDVLCSPPIDTSHLAPYNHEEADTRIFLHVADAIRNRYSKFMIHTKDTDIVVLGVAEMEKLDIDELWVAFGSGNTLRYVPVHDIAASLGPQKSKALPLWYAFTGCDNVSVVASWGKLSAWSTWNVFPVVTNVFIEL